MHLEHFLGGRIQHAYGGGVLGAVEHGIVIAERRDGHVERPAVGFVHGQLQGYQRWGYGPIPVNGGFNEDVFDEVASIDDFIVHGFSLILPKMLAERFRPDSSLLTHTVAK